MQSHFQTTTCLTPDGGTHFNWPGFATWASNSVGMNIRNETLKIIVKELFPTFPGAT